MARNKAREERIKTLVAELLAEEEAEGADWRHETIDDIEDGMVWIGDQVAREFGMQKLARHTVPAPEAPPCPKCGCAGERVKEESRGLITSRGKVPVCETKYRCRKCRRHFFPSDGCAGA